MADDKVRHLCATLTRFAELFGHPPDGEERRDGLLVRMQQLVAEIAVEHAKSYRPARAGEPEPPGEVFVAEAGREPG